MSRAEQGKTLFTVCLSASVGAGAGLFGKDAGLAAAAVWLLANLIIALAGVVYWRWMERKTFLDGYEECSAGCKSHILRRELWRLPDGPKMGGAPVCRSCFVSKEGRAPNEMSGDHRAHATREERLENTREGKKERRRLEKNKRCGRHPA
jgi:hypothetical protein